jgi:hypothetical protein
VLALKRPGVQSRVGEIDELRDAADGDAGALIAGVAG